MTAGAIVAILLGLAAVTFVLAPLFRKDAAEAERVASAFSEAEELQSQREMALTALRDLEEDRATGKIGDRDYDELKAKLQTRAVEILKRLDAIGDPGAPKPLHAVPSSENGG
jgi:cytochrome c-type biogenesis protein CcmI